MLNEKNLLYDKLYEELNSKYLVIISQLKDRHKERENTLQNKLNHFKKKIKNIKIHEKNNNSRTK